MITLKLVPAPGWLLATALSLSALGLGGCDSGKEAEAEFDPAQITLPSTPTEAQSQIQTLQAQLREDPNNEMLLTTLGDVYFEARQFPDAIPIYEKAAAINPANADTYNDLGLSYHYTGQTEKALAALDKAIEADPLYQHAYLSKGFILHTLGRPDEATAPLTKLKELDAGGPLGQEAERLLQQIRKAGEQPQGNN